MGTRDKTCLICGATIEGYKWKHYMRVHEDVLKLFKDNRSRARCRLCRGMVWLHKDISIKQHMECAKYGKIKEVEMSGTSKWTPCPLCGDNLKGTGKNKFQHLQEVHKEVKISRVYFDEANRATSRIKCDRCGELINYAGIKEHAWGKCSKAKPIKKTDHSRHGIVRAADMAPKVEIVGDELIKDVSGLALLKSIGNALIQLVERVENHNGTNQIDEVLVKENKELKARLNQIQAAAQSALLK